MEIVDDDQYKALSFVAVANRGGNRPTEVQLREWMTASQPKSAKRGKLIKPGRDAVYESSPSLTPIGTGLKSLMDSMDNNQTAYGVFANSGIWKILDSINSVNTGIFHQKMVKPAVPPVYGPDEPAETFIEHLIRLQWLDSDERGGLGVTPLGRALLRSVSIDDQDSDLLDVVVLDANNELAYPIFVKKLAEAGDALLVDPYLRIEQLLTVKAYTTVSRVLISARVKQEDRAAMAVLVNVGGDYDLEIRVADVGVLHDRLIISDDQVLTIGTSINTIGRQHPTVLTPLPDLAADTFREHAEKWWEEAALLAAYPPYEDEEDEGQDLLDS